MIRKIINKDVEEIRHKVGVNYDTWLYYTRVGEIYFLIHEMFNPMRNIIIEDIK